MPDGQFTGSNEVDGEENVELDVELEKLGSEKVVVVEKPELDCKHVPSACAVVPDGQLTGAADCVKLCVDCVKVGAGCV